MVERERNTKRQPLIHWGNLLFSRTGSPPSANLAGLLLLACKHLLSTNINMSDFSPFSCDLTSCDFFKQVIIKLWGPHSPQIIESLDSRIQGPCPFCEVNWSNPPSILREESLFTWTKLMKHFMLCPSQISQHLLREDILISWPFIDLFNLVYGLSGSNCNYYSTNQSPFLTIDRTSPPTLTQAVTRHMIQRLSQETQWQETRYKYWRVARSLCSHPGVPQLKLYQKRRRMQKRRQYSSKLRH